LGEDVSALTIEETMARYGEAVVMREFEVGVFREAIVQAFGGGK
jgi:hypothetical protein